MIANPAAPPRSNRRLLLWSAIAGLYAIAVIAMLTTRESSWTGFDFAMAALLLGGMGLGIEGVARTANSPRLRLALFAAVVLLVALIWADGAVGVF